jgi:hypothetical protein
MGRWLIENLQGLGPLPVPDRSEDIGRPIPYIDQKDEEWLKSEQGGE